MTKQPKRGAGRKVFRMYSSALFFESGGECGWIRSNRMHPNETPVLVADARVYKVVRRAGKKRSKR